MIGNANGSFQAPVTFSTGAYSWPSSVIVGDFNNDGQQDLAVSNSYAHNIGIFLGFGNGTFLAQATFSTGVGSTPYAIASGDFNRDGKLDLVISNIGLHTVDILLDTCDCCMSD